jgi:hypothetical protein
MLEIKAVEKTSMIGLNDVKSCKTIRICYFTYNAHYSKGTSVKQAIHSLRDGKIINKSASVSLD